MAVSWVAQWGATPRGAASAGVPNDERQLSEDRFPANFADRAVRLDGPRPGRHVRYGDGLWLRPADELVLLLVLGQDRAVDERRTGGVAGRGARAAPDR